MSRVLIWWQTSSFSCQHPSFLRDFTLLRSPLPPVPLPFPPALPYLAIFYYPNRMGRLASPHGEGRRARCSLRNSNHGTSHTSYFVNMRPDLISRPAVAQNAFLWDLKFEVISAVSTSRGSPPKSATRCCTTMGRLARTFEAQKELPLLSPPLFRPLFSLKLKLNLFRLSAFGFLYRISITCFIIPVALLSWNSSSDLEQI